MSESHSSDRQVPCHCGNRRATGVENFDRFTIERNGRHVKVNLEAKALIAAPVPRVVGSSSAPGQQRRILRTSKPLEQATNACPAVMNRPAFRRSYQSSVFFHIDPSSKQKRRRPSPQWYRLTRETLGRRFHLGSHALRGSEQFRAEWQRIDAMKPLAIESVARKFPPSKRRDELKSSPHLHILPPRTGHQSTPYARAAVASAASGRGASASSVK